MPTKGKNIEHKVYFIINDAMYHRIYQTPYLKWKKKKREWLDASAHIPQSWNAIHWTVISLEPPVWHLGFVADTVAAVCRYPTIPALFLEEAIILPPETVLQICMFPIKLLSWNPNHQGDGAFWGDDTIKLDGCFWRGSVPLGSGEFT